MKILVANFPYAGHTMPTLPIIKKLVENGHDVTYVNSEKWRDKIESLGAKFVPYDHYPKNPLFITHADMNAFKSTHDTITRIINNEHFDLFMYEFYFFYGNEIAKKIGIPAVRFCSQHVFTEKVLKEYSKNSLTWKLIKIPLISRIISIAFSLGIKTKIKRYEKAMIYDYPDLNIIFTCEDFQIKDESIDKNKCVFIGSSANNDYIESQEYKNKANNFIKQNYIDLSRPLIYVSMGTLMKGTRRAFENCIKAFNNKDVTVVVSAGREYEKLKKINNSNNIHIFDFVPQLEILQYTDLFITHGGMNSVNEAMFLGVPMLVIPVDIDQLTNAKLIEKYEMGLEAKLKKVTAEEIYEKSMYILNDEKIQKNIKKWQQKQIDAGGVNRAVEKIEEYYKRKKKER